MPKKSIWLIVALVGGYIACQMMADISATKLVLLGSLVIPGGTFIFTITFTLRDMLHKRLGKEWAVASIVLAGLVNLVMAGYTTLINDLPGVVDAQVASFNVIFGLVPSIVIASIVAEVVSELIDTTVYHAVMQRLQDRFQWARVVISNAISLPIDSLIFGSLAFVLLPALLGGDVLPWSAIPSIVGGQILWKAIVTVISIPAIYLVKDKPLTV